MMKKLLCVLIAAILLLGALPAGAITKDSGSVGTISVLSGISVSGGKPAQVGQKPDYTFRAHSDHADEYYLLNMSWWNLTDGHIIQQGSSETFKSNKTYALSLTFACHEGYRFTNNLIYITFYNINGDGFPCNRRCQYNLDNSEGGSIRRFYYVIRMDDDLTRFVTVDSNGGTGYMLPMVASRDVKFTLPECTLTPPEGQEFYAWGSYKPGDKIWITKDTEITPEWRASTAGKTKISSVSTELVKSPKVGDKPSVSSYTPSSSNYTIKAMRWYDNQLDREMQEYETFKANHSYALHITYCPKSDYYFPEPEEMTAGLGNVTTYKFSYYIGLSGLNGYPNRYVVYEFDGLPETISSVETEVYKPRAGVKLNYTATMKYSGVSPSVYRWYEGGTVSSPGRTMSSSESFKAGSAYIAEVNVDAKIGSVFADGSVPCTINGVAATEITTNYPNGFRKYRVKFTTPAAGTEISSVSAQIGAVTVGKSLPAESTIQSGSNKYTVSIANWYLSGTVYSPSSACPGNHIVKDGESFILSLRFKPVSSAAFTEDVTAKINGQSAVRYGSIDRNGGFVCNIRLTAQAPSLGVLLGDADGDGEVAILDATAIQRHLASLSTKSFVEKAADADESGEVAILDATAIQRWLAGLKTHPGIGEKYV